MAPREALLLVVAFTAIAAGCAKPEDKFIGQYAGKLEFSPEAKAKMDKSAAMSGMLQNMMKQVTMKLDLRKDKTYSMSAVVMGKETSSTGTWTFAENKVTLTPTNATGPTGQKVAINSGKSQAFNPSEDGKTLTMLRGAGQEQVSMVFTRN